MDKRKQGNLLNAEEDIIVHQVNVQGFMGGGLARQLADKYSDLERTYKEFCDVHDNDYSQLKGEVLMICVGDKIIANMFSQKPNFETDYEAMEKALKKIKEYADNGQTIAMSLNIGNGIAKGQEGKAEEIAKRVFNGDTEIVLYEYIV